MAGETHVFPGNRRAQPFEEFSMVLSLTLTQGEQSVQ